MFWKQRVHNTNMISKSKKLFFYARKVWRWMRIDLSRSLNMRSDRRANFVRHLWCTILARRRISRASGSRVVLQGRAFRLTVKDQKRNEHTGSPPPPPSLSLRDSTIWLCLYSMRQCKRERERKRETERGGRKRKRERKGERRQLGGVRFSGRNI